MMPWYAVLGIFLPPILTIAGFVLRLESRLSRIEGMLELICRMMDPEGNCGGGEERGKGAKGL